MPLAWRTLVMETKYIFPSEVTMTDLKVQSMFSKPDNTVTIRGVGSQHQKLSSHIKLPIWAQVSLQHYGARICMDSLDCCTMGLGFSYF
jgi:hypothetical protein